jgi:hypothetical protein
MKLLSFIVVNITITITITKTIIIIITIINFKIFIVILLVMFTIILILNFMLGPDQIIVRNQINFLTLVISLFLLYQYPYL